MEQAVIEIPPTPPTEPAHPPSPSKRRRAWLIAAVVAAVAAGVGVWVANRPAGLPDAKAIGLPVVRGDILYQPDGSKVVLGLTEFGYRLTQFAEVPAGIVIGYDRLDGGGDNTVELWHPGGMSLELAHPTDMPFHVSLDGHTLIAVDGSGVHGIDIDTGVEMHHTDFGYVQHAAGDWAILSRDGGPGANGSQELWNARTGAEIPFAPTDRGLDVAGVGPDGSVLEVVYSGPSVDLDHNLLACVAVVAPAATVPTTYDGYCAKFLNLGLDESPDGRWAIFHYANDGAGDTLGAVRIADLRTSHWVPVPADPDQGIAPNWVSAQSFWTGGDRCTVYGHCTELHLGPDDMLGTLNGV